MRDWRPPCFICLCVADRSSSTFFFFLSFMKSVESFLQCNRLAAVELPILCPVNGMHHLVCDSSILDLKDIIRRLSALLDLHS